MKPKYLTWIKFKKMLLFVFFFFCAIFASFWINYSITKGLFLIVAISFGYISAMLLISYYYFSEKGGNYQELIHDKIVSRINTKNGATVLDIGAGSGSLSIKTAKKNEQFTIKAIDYWGNNWEYSKELCINNAKIELVDHQIEFIKASASKLPFDNNSFDIIVSCLTFHEVKDMKDKNLVISEAIRVLKSGGQFIFFDLFYDKKIFGEFHDFINNIQKNGVVISETVNIDDLFENFPKILLHKKVLGYGVLIAGNKL